MLQALAQAAKKEAPVVIRTINGDDYEGTIRRYPLEAGEAHPSVTLDCPAHGGNVTITLASISALLPVRVSEYESRSAMFV